MFTPEEQARRRVAKQRPVSCVSQSHPPQEAHELGFAVVDVVIVTGLFLTVVDGGFDVMVAKNIESRRSALTFEKFHLIYSVVLYISGVEINNNACFTIIFLLL